MRKKIKIINSDFHNKNEKSILSFNLNIDEKEYNLFFSIDYKYGTYFCTDICDGVLTVLLPFAIKQNYDIISALPVSEELLYNIRNHFLPQICTYNNFQTPKIICDTVNTNYKPFAVSTGMSCGIDSFTTLKEYTIDCELPNFKITHLTFFENGAHHLGINGFSEKQKQCYEEQKERIISFCNKHNYELVVVESNINEVLSEAFNNDPFEYTHTYRNIGIVLQLQKLFKVYYYSSSYNLDSFGMKLYCDSAKYEKYLFSILSIGNTHIYSSNKAMTRIEKTAYISDFEQTYDNLLVCYMGGNNSAQSRKCIRTMITLDLLGKLDLYKNSFDLDSYYRNRITILSKIYVQKKWDPFMEEIYYYIKNNNCKIPLLSIVCGNIRLIIEDIYELLHIHICKSQSQNVGFRQVQKCRF